MSVFLTPPAGKRIFQDVYCIWNSFLSWSKKVNIFHQPRYEACSPVELPGRRS